MSVVSAPSPEENARQCLAPSSAARFSSSALRVGLPVREYSYPWCLPTPCCANVVAMWMGCTTAPVSGSGPWPTCRALVENPQLGSATTLVRDELEKVGPRDHRDGRIGLDHEHRLLAPEQRLERVVQRGVDRDLAQRSVHRRRHRRGDDRG